MASVNNLLKLSPAQGRGEHSLMIYTVAKVGGFMMGWRWGGWVSPAAGDIKIL